MTFRRTRSIVAASLVGLVAPLAASIAAAPAMASTNTASTNTASASTAASTAQVRIGTYNIQAGKSPAQFGQAVEALMPYVDVAGLQEINSKDKERVLERLKKQKGFNFFRQQPSSQEPVIWRSDRFSFISGRSVMLSAQTHVGAEFPARPTFDSKYVTVVRLRERSTDQLISIVNVHLSRGGTSAGKLRRDRPKLAALYSQQVRGLVSLVRSEQQWGDTFVMGDFNVSWRPDKKYKQRQLPFRSFKTIGMKANWHHSRPKTRGTRGTALLDQVYSARTPGQSKVLSKVKHSDHKPALATFTFRR